MKSATTIKMGSVLMPRAVSVVRAITKDEPPRINRRERIATMERVIKRKHDEINHMILTRDGLNTKIIEERLYLDQLYSELRDLTKVSG